MDVPASSSLSSSTENSRSAASDSENETVHQSQREAERSQRKTASEEDLVQIRASTAEVRRRIAAFMESKKAEASEINTREFCFDLPGAGEENSCARVDSVFVGRVGSSSHVRVSRVVNTQGPQTQAYPGQTDSAIHLTSSRDSTLLFKNSVEERLANAEQHLNINNDVKADLFGRLKAVEEGILFLNGLSPEYFENGRMPQPKRRRVAKAATSSSFKALSPTKLKNEYESISEIDQRIQALQTKLKEKSSFPVNENVCV